MFLLVSLIDFTLVAQQCQAFYQTNAFRLKSIHLDNGLCASPSSVRKTGYSCQLAVFQLIGPIKCPTTLTQTPLSPLAYLAILDQSEQRSSSLSKSLQPKTFASTNFLSKRSLQQNRPPIALHPKFGFQTSSFKRFKREDSTKRVSRTNKTNRS